MQTALENSALENSLSSARENYERDGYVIAPGVLQADLIEEARSHITWLLEKHPDLRPENLHHNLVASDPFWVRLVSDDSLLDVAQEFIGPDIALFASHYIAKPPRDGQPVLWHQDGSYWPLEPMEVVTLWLALDDSTPENGCMRVIPQTHGEELRELQRRDDVANVLGSGLDEETVDEARAADVILKAGDVSIHHPNIIHGSNANTSDKWRRGLTIRYIPTRTRITIPKWPTFLLRGQAQQGVNEYLARPKYVEGAHLPFRGSEEWS